MLPFRMHEKAQITCDGNLGKLPVKEEEVDKSYNILDPTHLSKRPVRRDNLRFHWREQ